MFLLHIRIHSGYPNEIPDPNAEAGQNIVFGDHGLLRGVDSGVNAPVGDPNPAKTDDDYQMQVLGLVTAIDVGDVNGAANDRGNGNDTITTGIGRDIIVGGGGHGLATAYYLAKVHGITNVAVVEKGWLGGGNTGRNTTIIRSKISMILSNGSSVALSF